MSISQIAKAAGAATGNPLLSGAGALAQMLGFRSRHVRKGRRRVKRSAKGSRANRRGGRRRAGPRGSKRGFDSRHVRSGGGSGVNGASSFGGPEVTTVNAPVAFARAGQLKPFFNIKGLSEDGCVVHTVDMLAQASSPSAIYNTLQLSAVNPTSTSLFPYLASTMAPGYEKFKLKMLTLHYVHFTPTSTPGSIYLWWNPDALATTPATSSALLNDSNSCQGAVYEDLALEVDLKGLTDDWQYVGTTTVDNRLNSAGICGWFNENCPSTATPLGNLYIEAVFEFVGRKLPAQNEPVALLRSVLCLDLPAQKKRAALHRFVDALVLRDKTEIKEKTPDELLSCMLSKLEVKEQPTGYTSLNPTAPKSASLGYANL